VRKARVYETVPAGVEAPTETWPQPAIEVQVMVRNILSAVTGQAQATPRALTEDQWFTKARRHTRWDAAWRAELATLESRIDEAQDAQTVRRIIDRIEAIEQRTEWLKLVMERHIERAPAELLPELLRSLDVRVQ
jgi:hypothetical protein